MFNKKIFILLVLPLLLAACANPKKTEPFANEWPLEIPQLSYYQTLYTQDSHNQSVQSEENYLMWVKRFYEGWAVSKGWLEVSDQLIEAIAQERRTVVREKLASLGKDVSGEWAKKSEQRLIFTKNLSIWGSALSEASYQESIESVIDHITQDVDLMLANQLNPDSITLERYFPDMELDEEFSAL